MDEQQTPALVLPFAHPTAFVGACSFSRTGIKVYPRKPAELNSLKSAVFVNAPVMYCRLPDAGQTFMSKINNIIP